MTHNEKLERSWLQEDQLLASLNKKWSEIERELYRSKWFDYRFMSPVEATMEFAKEYEKVYRQQFATVIDKDTSLYVNVKIDVDFRSVTKLPNAKISALWRARQFADSMCMPYDLYIRLAFTSVLKYWKRKHMPQPQQLYSKRVIEEVWTEWSKRQESALFVASDLRFLAENYANTTVQNDHIDWLIKLANIRANAAYYIYQFVYERKVIPLEVAQKKLDADILEKARSYL